MSVSQRAARVAVPAWAGLSLLLGSLFAGCLESGPVLQKRAEITPDAGQGGALPKPPAGGEGGALPGPSCDATFQSGTNFAVCRAEYWGSPGDDHLQAAAITAGGDVLLAGRTAAQELAVPALQAPGAGAGVLERRAPNGDLLSAARLAGDVTALATQGARVLAGTDVGLAALDDTLQSLEVEAPLGAVTRLAASAAGAVSLLADGRVLSLDPSLAVLRELPLDGAHAEDVAIDDAGMIAVTGSRDAAAGGTCQGRLPFVRAFAPDGSLAYRAYDFDDAPGWCASSTGKRLFLSAGKLYYAGEQQGGNSVHLRDPRDLAVQAPLVAYDMFSNGAGKAIDVYSFVARFDWATGLLEAGQVIVPRDGMTGSTLSSTALAVDAAGRIYLAGEIGCCIEQREARTVAGLAVGPYQTPELSLLVLSADLKQRLLWTTFTGNADSPGAELTALAVGEQSGILLANVAASPSLLTTPNATTASGSSDGYLVLFPTR